jgi:hypothetical protein
VYTLDNPTVYFAHPTNTYGTLIESRCLLLIRQTFPGFAVINPGDLKIQEEFEKWKREHPEESPMEFFYPFARKARCIIALPFGDGRWGAGVMKESVEGYNSGALNAMLTYRTHVSPIKLVFLPKPPTEKCLSVEETRLRIRTKDGKTRQYG